MLQSLPSAAGVIGASRVKPVCLAESTEVFFSKSLLLHGL